MNRTPDPRPLSRRAVLAMLVAGATACTGLPAAPRPESAARRAEESVAASPKGSGSDRQPHAERGRELQLARARPYEPLAAEALPNVKRVAGRFAQRLLTYRPGTSGEEIVAAALGSGASKRRVRRIAAAAAPALVAGAQSVGRVTYPQFGGLQPVGPGATRASIMVVVEQLLLSGDGERRRVTRTMDVRLQVVGGVWRVRDLYSAGGVEVPRPGNLPAAAAAVVDNRRIELPDTARWDIYAGRIEHGILRTMSDVAQRMPFSVAVLRTGHPHNVFGQRKRVSSHTLGRAVDIWAVNGKPVVEQAREGSASWKLVGALLEDRAVSQVGSPFDRDPPPPGSRSFSDTVHSDHVHIAVDVRRKG